MSWLLLCHVTPIFFLFCLQSRTLVLLLASRNKCLSELFLQVRIKKCILLFPTFNELHVISATVGSSSNSGKQDPEEDRSLEKLFYSHYGFHKGKKLHFLTLHIDLRIVCPCLLILKYFKITSHLR